MYTISSKGVKSIQGGSTKYRWISLQKLFFSINFYFMSDIFFYLFTNALVFSPCIPVVVYQSTNRQKQSKKSGFSESNV